MSLTPKTLKINVVFDISPPKLFLAGHGRPCSNSRSRLQKLLRDPKVSGRMWWGGVWHVHSERSVQVGCFYEDTPVFPPRMAAAENRVGAAIHAEGLCALRDFIP